VYSYKNNSGALTCNYFLTPLNTCFSDLRSSLYRFSVVVSAGLTGAWLKPLNLAEIAMFSIALNFAWHLCKIKRYQGRSLMTAHSGLNSEACFDALLSFSFFYIFLKTTTQQQNWFLRHLSPKLPVSGVLLSAETDIYWIVFGCAVLPVRAGRDGGQ